MFEDLVNSIDIDDLLDNLYDLLDKEIYINYKKENGIKLTKDEYIFDTYFVKPSTMLKFLIKEEGSNN